METNQIVEKAKQDFALKLGNMSVTPDSIILVLKYAMEIIEVTTLSGPDKKSAVIQLVERAVIDARMDEHVETILLEMINYGILSHTIDIVVSATRGELHLNGVMGASQIACSSLVTHCLPCIKTPQPHLLKR